MTPPPESPAPASAPAPAAKPGIAARLRTAAVALFVAWNLLFLLVRNLVEHFPGAFAPAPGSPAATLDRWTDRYGNAAGIEQGWGMFGSPVSRVSPFPGVRIEFADGGRETILSDNEPADPAAFARFGGVRDRRLEDYLLAYAGTRSQTGERPVWEAYLRRAVARWCAEHPSDRRRPIRAVLESRDYPVAPPEGTLLFRTPLVHDVFVLDLSLDEECSPRRPPGEAAP